MSTASRVTLLAACGITAGIAGFVHYKQWSDKAKLHEGVIRDTERQQMKKVENLYFLQQQIEMGKMLKKQQLEDEAIAAKLMTDSKPER